MFLKISTNGDANIEVFVGPFMSEVARTFLKEHWKKKFRLSGHNQVKFFLYDSLPEGCSAILPRNFRDSKESKILMKNPNKGS